MQGTKLLIFGSSIFDKKMSNRLDSRRLDYDVQLYRIGVKKEVISGKYLIKEKCFIPKVNADNINLIQISYPSSLRGAHIVEPEITAGFDSLSTGWGKLHNNIYMPVLELNISDLEVWALRDNYDIPFNYTKIATIYAGNGGKWHVIINKEIKEDDFNNYGVEKYTYSNLLLNEIANYDLEQEENFYKLADFFNELDYSSRENFIRKFCSEPLEEIKSVYGNYTRVLKINDKILVFKILDLVAMLEKRHDSILTKSEEEET